MQRHFSDVGIEGLWLNGPAYGGIERGELPVKVCILNTCRAGVHASGGLMNMPLYLRASRSWGYDRRRTRHRWLSGLSTGTGLFDHQSHGLRTARGDAIA